MFHQIAEVNLRCLTPGATLIIRCDFLCLINIYQNLLIVCLLGQVNQAADKLKSVIAPFVESSKTMAINISDQVMMLIQRMITKFLILNLLLKNDEYDFEQGRQARWRTASASLLEMVKEVAKLFSDLNM